jgi:hypothetical protein
MDEIKRSLLEKAEREFRAITDSPSYKLNSQDIDWKLVKDQLSRLDSALAESNAGDFNEALLMVLKRLSPPVELRGRIGLVPEDESQSVPEPVWELLNHIVDRIQHRLALSPELGSNRVGQQEDSTVSLEEQNDGG